jgi:hypothetical protein
MRDLGCGRGRPGVLRETKSAGEKHEEKKASDGTGTHGTSNRIWSEEATRAGGTVFPAQLLQA